MSIKGRYIKIATKFWSDEKMIELDPESKLLYLYVLSCTHSNMAGYYRLPKPYIKADLDLSDKQLNKAFKKLLGKGLIRYCEKSSVVLIPNYYKYNSIQNKNQAKGAANRTSELPKNSLVENYKEAINSYADSYKKELMKGLPKEFDKGLNKRSGNTETDSDTESETDTKEVEEESAHTRKENQSDEQLEERKENSQIPNAFYNTFCQMITPFQFQSLNSYIEDGMSEEAVILALKQAASANANSLNYVEKILDNWLEKDIKSKKEAKMAIRDFERRKNNNGKQVSGDHRAEKSREPPEEESIFNTR